MQTVIFLKFALVYIESVVSLALRKSRYFRESVLPSRQASPFLSYKRVRLILHHLVWKGFAEAVLEHSSQQLSAPPKFRPNKSFFVMTMCSAPLFMIIVAVVGKEVESWL